LSKLNHNLNCRKSSPTIWAISVIFKKCTVQSKGSAIGRKFAQSGHPGTEPYTEVAKEGVPGSFAKWKLTGGGDDDDWRRSNQSDFHFDPNPPISNEDGLLMN
jgi:hypothetical protein